jgi:hypothetical protein
VAKVRQPNTAKVARQYLSTMWASGAATAPTPTAELLLPEEFMSAIISQVECTRQSAGRSLLKYFVKGFYHFPCVLL